MNTVKKSSKTKGFLVVVVLWVPQLPIRHSRSRETPAVPYGQRITADRENWNMRLKSHGAFVGFDIINQILRRCPDNYRDL
jgi:hypothetical protein